MRDYVLVIPFDEPADEELIHARLFLTRSTGSTSTEDAVSAYFDSPEDREAAAELLPGFAMERIERERVDWLELYEQSLEPLTIGRRFVVAPDPRLLAGTDRLTIVVPQEQAFGTGSHETTALCMEILESLDLDGRRGLDVGSGSGILAIAMHRLGAAKVVAFDNDPDAYGALRDNRMRNGVPEEALALFIGGVEALRGGAFDAITMNIIPEVILPLLGAVVERMAVDGRLILSGILTVRRDDVIEAARERGLELLAEHERGEWWAGSFGAGQQRPVQISKPNGPQPSTKRQVKL